MKLAFLSSEVLGGALSARAKRGRSKISQRLAIKQGVDGRTYVFPIYTDLEWNACQTYILLMASLTVGPSSLTAHTLSHSLTSTVFSQCEVSPSSLNLDKCSTCKHKEIQRTPTWRRWSFSVMLGPNSFHQRQKTTNGYLGARHWRLSFPSLQTRGDSGPPTNCAV